MSSLAVAMMQHAAQQDMSAAGAGGGPPAASQAAQFEALMQQAHMAPPQPIGGAGSILSGVAHTLDSEVRKPFLEMNAFHQQAPSMTLVEMNEAHDRIVWDAAQANFDLDATLGVAKATNSAVSALVRNQ